MAKKVYPEFINADRPKYADINWVTQAQQQAYIQTRKTNKQITHRLERCTNKWSPDLVLPPWLHFSSNALLEFTNAEGHGPTWHDMYKLQEFVMCWYNSWPLSRLATKFELSDSQVRTVCDSLRLLGSGKESRSMLTHFSSKLIMGEPIVRPDVFIRNPLPPDALGCLQSSFAFYKVPNLQGKENEIGSHSSDVYYCPQLYPGTLVVGEILLRHMNTDYTELFSSFVQDKVLYKSTPYRLNEIYEFREYFHPDRINNLEQFKYVLFNTLISNRDNDYADAELAITFDSELPGRNHQHDTSYVRMYQQVWVEEYIKRTMWDRCTEHSLCIFSDAVHDKSQHVVDSSGHIHSGAYRHRHEYFTMPTKIRGFLHSIGVKGNCNPDFSVGGDRIHPIFDYVVKLSKSNKGAEVVPFKKGACLVDVLEHRIVANGAKLVLTESQWSQLINYMSAYEALNT
jgi:hypothetical protein